MQQPDYNLGHATSQQIAEDIDIGEAELFEDPNLADAHLGLSGQEIHFFKERGFIVKRGLLREPELFNRIRDYVWKNVPTGILKQNEPATWWDSADKKWTAEDAERVGLLTRTNWKMRSRGGIGSEHWLVNGVANHPNMRAMAKLFIGSPVKHCSRVRGIYGVFPQPPGSKGSLGPHADYMAAEISAMVLVDRVPERCGGFTIWPGSHQILHPHGDTIHGGIITGSEKSRSFRLARDSVLRDIKPLEIFGEPGDVIFWHPRLLHSAGINHSAESDDPILRLIVPCDYQRSGHTLYDDETFGPGSTYQWWVDTRNFREDVPATAENIWDGWVFATS
jgi:hypothetical protein